MRKEWSTLGKAKVGAFLMSNDAMKERGKLKGQLVSVVIPIYNEGLNLPELNSRVTKALNSMGTPWELIYVEDGSEDNSLELLMSYVKSDSHIKAIEFNRNYGQHAAVFAGLAQTRGDIIVTLDADLQNPPEEIPKLVAKVGEGYDVVGSVRKNRQDPLFRRVASKLINRMLINRMTGVSNKSAKGMTDYGCMLRAYNRKIVDQICRCKELSSFIPVLAMLYAKKTIEVEVKHAKRSQGPSRYGLVQLLKLQMDLMTGFSFLPLRFLSLCGAIIMVFGGSLGAFVVMRHFLVGGLGQFWIFVLLSALLFLVGGLFVGMGILGEYVGRIYGEVRQRPRYVIQNIHAKN